MNLQLNFTAWLFFFLAVLAWSFSFLLIKRHNRGEQFYIMRCFSSLFGYAWLAFFIDFILRFLVLVYDPLLSRRTSFPLWLIPEKSILLTWVYLLIFWCLFCAGFTLVYFGMPVRAPRVLLRLDALGQWGAGKIKLLDAITAITLIASIWVNYPAISVPRVLLTPIGRLSTLYVLPLTIAWGLYYKGYSIKTRCLIYMLPGIVTYLLSPYREHLIVLFLCWFVPALVIGKTLSTKRIIIGFAVLLVLGTLFTSAYREIKWEVIKTKVDQKRPTWVLISNRFHGFDSMTLTVYSVPGIFSFSQRPVVMGLIYQVIPRLFFPWKEASIPSEEFSTTIWSLKESGGVVKRAPARIAPSMPGNLYGINGLSSVILGALIWGGLVGFLERWIRALGPFGSSVLLVLFGLCVAGGMERDFINASAGIIHIAIVVLLLTAFFPFKPVRPLTPV